MPLNHFYVSVVVILPDGVDVSTDLHVEPSILLVTVVIEVPTLYCGPYSFPTLCYRLGAYFLNQENEN